MGHLARAISGAFVAACIVVASCDQPELPASQDLLDAGGGRDSSTGNPGRPDAAGDRPSSFCGTTRASDAGACATGTDAGAHPPVDTASCALRFGDRDDQTIQAVRVDATGGMTVTGTFVGTIDFGGGPVSAMTPQG